MPTILEANRLPLWLLIIICVGFVLSLRWSTFSLQDRLHVFITLLVAVIAGLTILGILYNSELVLVTAMLVGLLAFGLFMFHFLAESPKDN